MNVLVDGRTFCNNSAGISTFLRCSLVEWANSKPEDNIVVFTPRELDKTIANYKWPKNVSFWIIQNSLLTWLPNAIILLLCMPFLSRSSCKFDVYYSAIPFLPFFLPSHIKKLIVVHDVVHLEYKETTTLRVKLSSFLFFERAIKIADRIWCNSEYTKNKVEQYISKRKCKNIYVGCAIDDSVYYVRDCSEQNLLLLKKRLGIMNKFALFVGSLEPRKNLDFLLSIASALYTEYGIQLLVVGGKGWKNSRLWSVINNDSFIKESTIFAGYLTNEELADVYNIADCFVSASLNEGFGMPQLEALSCGCPVITAGNSAMVEVAESCDGATTIAGYNREEWIQTIVKTISNKRLNDICCRVSSKYNWSNILKDVFIYIE